MLASNGCCFMMHYEISSASKYNRALPHKMATQQHCQNGGKFEFTFGFKYVLEKSRTQAPIPPKLGKQKMESACLCVKSNA
jgi:hypothetical protein